MLMVKKQIYQQNLIQINTISDGDAFTVEGGDTCQSQELNAHTELL